MILETISPGCLVRASMMLFLSYGVVVAEKIPKRNFDQHQAISRPHVVGKYDPDPLYSFCMWTNKWKALLSFAGARVSFHVC